MSPLIDQLESYGDELTEAADHYRPSQRRSARRTRVRRNRLAVALVGACVLAVVVAVVLARAPEPSVETTRQPTVGSVASTLPAPIGPDATAAAGPIPVPAGLNWYEEMLWRCDHGDYGVVGGPDGMVRVADRGTGGLALFTPKDYCYQAANLAPSPTGTLTTNLAVALNGVLHPDYFRRVNSSPGRVTNGDPVDFDEAQLIIAQQRAALG